MADLQQTPEPIEYPSLYIFRVVALYDPTLRERMRLIVQSIVGPIPDDALSERPSAHGKYRAIHVTCLLQSEEQRIAVYEKLREDPAVKLRL